MTHEADETWFEVQKREPNYQGRWILVTEHDVYEDYKTCEVHRKAYQAVDEFGLYRSKKVRA